MGVLEARKDAEKVGFPVVGEEKKDASNIIDYDIHEEITIDTSSVFNANNDTTTGMATVIPGVNAPKLKLSTSIYVDKLDIPSVGATFSQSYSFYRPSDASVYWRNFTLTDVRGNGEFTYYDSPKGVQWSGMKVPYEGTYQIDVTYPTGGTGFGFIVEWRTPNGGGSADTIWRTFTGPWDTSEQKESFKREFAKGEIFGVFCRMDRSSSTPLSVPGKGISFTMTKL